MKDNRSFAERFKIWFGVAAVELGIVCGGAMASGSYAINYFARYGGGHLFTFGLIWMLFLVVAGGIELNFARVYKLYDYNSFYKELWGVNRPDANPILRAIVSVFFDFYSILTCMVGEAACIALGGVMLNSVFGWPLMVGNVIFGIIFVVLMFKGSDFLRKASGFMTVVLLACFVIVLVAVIMQKGDILKERLFNFEIGVDWTGQSLWSGYWAVIAYSATIFNGAVMLTNCAQKLKTTKDGIMTAVLSAVFCGFCFITTALIVLPFLPEELMNSAPILTICSEFLGSKFFFAIYWIIMLFSLASSGPPITFNMANRCLKWWRGNSISEEKKLIVLGIVIQAVAIAISALGLTTLVSQGLSLSGKLAMPAIVLPVILTCIPRMIKKSKRDRLAAESEAVKTDKN